MGSKSRLSRTGSLVNTGALPEVLTDELTRTAIINSHRLSLGSPPLFKKNAYICVGRRVPWIGYKVSEKDDGALSVSKVSRTRVLRMKKDKTNPGFGDAKQEGKAAPMQVTINLAPGPASPARKQAWRNFWAKLLSEGKHTTEEDITSSDESE